MIKQTLKNLKKSGGFYNLKKPFICIVLMRKILLVRKNGTENKFIINKKEWNMDFFNHNHICGDYHIINKNWVTYFKSMVASSFTIKKIK